jgi:hypothetical protein
MSKSKNKIFKRNKKSRKTKRRKSFRKKVLGGTISKRSWITSDNNEIQDEEVCPLCQAKFKETPGCAIYVTSCDHKFHNNCLLDYCKYYQEVNGKTVPIPCPLYSDDKFFMDDVDTYAFKTQNINDPSKRGIFANTELGRLYFNGQPNCISEIEEN